MKMCSGCRRYVLRAWYLDGTRARYCAACIRVALAVRPTPVILLRYRA